MAEVELVPEAEADTDALTDELFDEAFDRASPAPYTNATGTGRISPRAD